MTMKFSPTDNIPARTAIAQAATYVVEVAEAVILSEPRGYGGPATVYLEAARRALASLQENLATVEAYLTAAEAAADPEARRAAALART